MNKKGVFQISFGFLFSVILIAIFIAVAIYAIKNFLSFKSCSETLIFKNDLQEEVNKAFATSGEVSYKTNFTLPRKIKYVCFLNKEKEGYGNWENFYDKLAGYTFSNKNVYFWPLNAACKGQKAFKLEHINISKITETDNPYCIKNKKGIVEIRIIKEFYDNLVNIK